MSKRSILTFDRWDFLGTRVLLAVIAVVVTAFWLVVPVTQWWRGQPLVWTLQTATTTADGAARSELDPLEGVTLSWPDQVSASIPDAGPGTWLVSLLPGLLMALAVVIIVLSLLRLLSRIQGGGEVARPALRTLRVVGATLIIGAATVSVAGGIADAVVLEAAATRVSGDSVSFTLDLGGPLVAGAVGLVCGALAEAFAHLADDVEGLI